MKKLAFILLAGLALSGCGILKNAIGADSYSNTLKGADLALTAYVDVYQPAVMTYGSLPVCQGGGPVLCRDQVVHAKLKAADAAAIKSMVAAKKVMNGEKTDGGEITEALVAIGKAEAEILGTGIVLSVIPKS